MTTVKIAKREHPLYTENITSWEFFMESYKGGKAYIEANLDSHRLEAPEDYKLRKERAYYLNYCAPIVTIPADFIFKKEATRPQETALTAFRTNVDRRGTNMHDFMKKLCILSDIYGQIHVLMDRPKPIEADAQRFEEGKITKADNIGKYRPYAVIVMPEDLKDWSIDTESGDLNWVLIKETVYEDANHLDERAEVEQYRVWTKEEWILYDEDDNEIDRGPHNLGFVPLFTMYHKDIDLDMVGEGMLKDVAETNRILFNWCSNIDEMVARQTFSQLTTPDDGEMYTEEVDEYGRSKALRRIGSSTIFTYPANASHAPAFISPDTTQIEIIWEMVTNHVREMFRMSGLISAKTSMIQLQQRTGKAQQMEFLDMAVFLASKAKTLEEMENKINLGFCSWQGEKVVPARTIYPEKFDLVDPNDLVDLFNKVLLSGISGTLNKEMAKRLVPHVLPHAEDAIVVQINKEIEENEVLEDPTAFFGQTSEENNPEGAGETGVNETENEEEREDKRDEKKDKRSQTTKVRKKPRWRNRKKSVVNSDS